MKNTPFYELLRNERIRTGITQEELAKHLNLDRSSISVYECGERKIPTELLVSWLSFFNFELTIVRDCTDEYVDPTGRTQKFKRLKRERNILLSEHRERQAEKMKEAFPYAHVVAKGSMIDVAVIEEIDDHFLNGKFVIIHFDSGTYSPVPKATPHEWFGHDYFIKEPAIPMTAETIRWNDFVQSNTFPGIFYLDSCLIYIDENTSPTNRTIIVQMNTVPLKTLNEMGTRLNRYRDVLDEFYAISANKERERRLKTLHVEIMEMANAKLVESTGDPTASWNERAVYHRSFMPWTPTDEAETNLGFPLPLKESER